MRRELCVLTLSATVLLGGCGASVPNLSNEDNDIAAQYVADALLKNDKNYDESLDYDHSILQPTPTPVPTAAPTKAPEKKDEPSQNGGGSTSEEQPAFTSVSLSELYGVKGVEISATSYELKNSYGDYVVVTPKKGNQLIVVYFRISNTGTTAKRVNLAKQGVEIQLLVNGQNIGGPLLSIAEGDLQTYNKKMEAGKKKQGVLLFEVGKSEKISNLELQFTKGNKQAVTSVR